MKHILLITIAAVVLVGCGEVSSNLNLYEAAESGDIETVKNHLNDGVDIELKCAGCGSTALGHAAKKGHKEIAKLLISKGADVNASDEEGRVPLHFAAANSQKEIAELLISKGANVNAKLEPSDIFIVLTPLDMAEDETTIDLLRKHGGKTGEELKAESN